MLSIHADWPHPFTLLQAYPTDDSDKTVCTNMGGVYNVVLKLLVQYFSCLDLKDKALFFSYQYDHEHEEMDKTHQSKRTDRYSDRHIPSQMDE